MAAPEAIAVQLILKQFGCISDERALRAPHGRILILGGPDLALIVLLTLVLFGIGAAIGSFAAPENDMPKARRRLLQIGIAVGAVGLMTLHGGMRSNFSGDYGTGLLNVLIFLPIFLVLLGIMFGFWIEMRDMKSRN